MELKDFALELQQKLRLDVDHGSPMSEVTRLEDWNLDSLQAYELIITIEAMAEVSEPPLETPQLRTLGDAFDYYLSLRTRMRPNST